jgi:hypothetical protein
MYDHHQGAGPEGDHSLVLEEIFLSPDELMIAKEKV